MVSATKYSYTHIRDLSYYTDVLIIARLIVFGRMCLNARTSVAKSMWYV